MKSCFIILNTFIFSLCNAQSINVKGRVPTFLVTATVQELEETFLAPYFFRFSSTRREGVIVAYENVSGIKIGTLNKIIIQVNDAKLKLLNAIYEKPEIEFFEWADYMECTEIYPCGLVAVFNNNMLCEVWIYFKNVSDKTK